MNKIIGMFSKACEYSIKIMAYMAACQRDNMRVGLKEVASAINSPEPFTAKILQQLVRQGLLVSFKGPNGGFFLERPADKILLREIVEKIDGPSLIDTCVLGFKNCSGEKPCPIHHNYKPIKEMIQNELLSVSIAQIDKGIIEGLGNLKDVLEA